MKKLISETGTYRIQVRSNSKSDFRDMVGFMDDTKERAIEEMKKYEFDNPDYDFQIVYRVTTVEETVIA